MKLFSNFTLKIMAIIFMLMDCIYTYAGRVEGFSAPIWFGYLGKLAIPIFIYLMVEGFFRTRSRVKYMKRLFGTAILMCVVDYIFNIDINIFLSLGLGVAFISDIEYIKTQKKFSKGANIGTIVAILLAAGMIFNSKSSIYGFIMLLIFYCLREKTTLKWTAYILFSIIWIIPEIGQGIYNIVLIPKYQWMMVFAVIPMIMYNGKAGIYNRFTKWMFYLDYYK